MEPTERSDEMAVADAGAATVSVVIPCFDVEEYLGDCVDSVLAQTYHDLQIVLVDDGSTDGTSRIVDESEELDARIDVIHQPNRGLGAARNAGVARSSGAFLLFLDSDDRLPPDAIARMVDSIERSGSDLVSGVAWRFDSTRRWRAEQYRTPFDADLPATHLFREPLLVYDQMACSKLYRRRFWDEQHLSFPEGTLYEDVVVVMAAHCRARSVDLISEPTYLWRRRESGALSITQDRHRPGSTAARFGALGRADRLLHDEAPHEVWVEHGVKVLTVDVRLYSRLLEGAGREFAEEFLGAAGELVSSISPEAVQRANPVGRELHRYLVAGDAAGVVACVRLLSGSDGRSARRVLAGIRWLTVHDPRAFARMAKGTLAIAFARVRSS